MPKRITIASDSKIYFVTYSVYKHVRIFAIDRIARDFLDNLRFYCKDDRCLLYAYVIMPDHVHLLLEMVGNNKLSDLIRDIKKYFSYRVKNQLLSMESRSYDRFLQNGRFRFWEQRFDEVTINSEKMFWKKLNYIHNNPIKAGLAERVEDYPYSSAGCYLNGGRSEDLPITTL